MRHLVPRGTVVLLCEGSGFESERPAASVTLGGSLNLSIGKSPCAELWCLAEACSVLILNLTLFQP